MQVQRSGDCGNSPKNILLEDLAVALLSGDGSTIAALTTDGVTWRNLGHPVVTGKAAVVALAVRERPPRSASLVIQHVVSHGRAGAVTAAVKHARRPATDVCCFVTFANAKGTAVDSIVFYAAS